MASSFKRPRESQRLIDIHRLALRRWDDCHAAQWMERQQSRDDRAFATIAGAQWAGGIGDQFQNRPKLEFNVVKVACTRIENEYRNSRLTVDFISKTGAEGDKLADTCDALYRSDEQDSNADEAYDNAFSEALLGGFGAWEYVDVPEDELDDENDKQRVRIEPITDADTSVFFDLNAKRQDKRDAWYAFRIDAMTCDAYKERFGEDANPSSWDKSIYGCSFDWFAPGVDVVYVATYYLVEEKKRNIHVYRLIDGTEARYDDEELDDDDGRLRRELESTQAHELRIKRVKKRRVCKYLLDGRGVLDDHGEIAGDRIPIVPVYGNRWFIDNIERVAGHVRYVKDPQRLKNVQLSKLMEIAAMGANEVPIFAPEQVEGLESYWENLNLDNPAYALAKPVTDKDGNTVSQGPIGYTKPPSVPPALAALVQQSTADIREILGNQQAGDVLLANTSGRAVEQQQQRLDMTTFIYMSNFAKAMKCGGEIWRSKARELYIEENRKMKAVSVDGQAREVTLNKPTVIGADTGFDNDMTKANFDVAVEVGPSTVSARAATVRTLSGLLAAAQLEPDAASAIVTTIMMNVEGEGTSGLRKFFREKGLRNGLVEPNEEEAAQLAQEAAQRQKDPQTVLAEGLAEEAVAKAAKARADTIRTVADSEKARAETQKIEVETIKLATEIGQPVPPSQPPR